MNADFAANELIRCYIDSPHPSYKVSHYFQIYAELFAHLRGTECTFIEAGVLNGGSLFMWRDWLGEKARIIGVDLNPEAKRWESDGFEIYIGDQGDPNFWQDVYAKVGRFDALLDDGGHQSFQQIVTLTEALKAAQGPCVIAIEDTITSFMSEFAAHRQHSFLAYAKASTDVLLAKTAHFYPKDFPTIRSPDIVAQFSSVYAVNFYTGMVAYRVNPALTQTPNLIWNRPPADAASDFRYAGTDSARVQWPDPFTDQSVLVAGGVR